MDIFTLLASILGAISTILSALLSSSASEKMKISRKKNHGEDKVVSIDFGASSNVHSAENGINKNIGLTKIEQRMNEIREALQHQKFIEQRNKWASSLLTFGQYVIGGILASSFIQQSLAQETVGFLGVFVLLSSIIHQRYRPDIKVRGAKERIFKLRVLIRRAEDELTALQSGSDMALSELEIIKILSKGLAEIDESEIQDMNNLLKPNEE